MTEKTRKPRSAAKKQDGVQGTRSQTNSKSKDAQEKKFDPQSLVTLLCAAPVIADRSAAESRLTDLRDATPRSHALRAYLKDEKAAALLAGLSVHSPYLWGLCIADADRLARILATDPNDRLEKCLDETRRKLAGCNDEDEAMKWLRQMKQEAHLLIAIADIGGVWDVRQVIAAITDMADCAVCCAFDFLLRQTADTGKIRLADERSPGQGCGVFVLALGKHGARELNYSSDVDLIVFFDPESNALDDPMNAAPLFVRITRQLVKLLQEHTEDGYVLRVDLRLRPDPGSTSIAISLPAAFDYYESVGQNWERAAYIKARAIAGDIALGEKFIGQLTPFIWRKYFDYAAIADIHAMKRQIHAVRGHGRIAIAGHDIKLGRGGIREVEFFVQTQQLIFGGRRPELRGRQTLLMLQALKDDGWITDNAVRELSEAYSYMRTIEHRLQMRIDEQTQRLPSEKDELEAFAGFCGYSGSRTFAEALTHQMEAVETHYARLFEDAPALSSASGNLVFTGSIDDPETILTLQKLGYSDPSRTIETIRGWHFGRRSAIQSARAREVLTDLVPALLESFSGSGDPDAALAAFDEALANMPASVELLSILKSNAAVRELFGDILGGAPKLAQIVTQRPHVLDAAIDPSMLGNARDTAYFKERSSRINVAQENTEAILDSMRDIALEESFLIGVRMLSGAIETEEAGFQYSMLADEMITMALDHVSYRFVQDYGVISKGRCAIIGMGKLGSMEMTSTSDLDLIVLYDFDPDHAESDGRKSLHANQYYARLTQRILSALTVSTRRGPLYDVDMRLRPSGRQGPVATTIASFKDYQSTEAEVWEHMALTRARVIAGPADFKNHIAAIIRSVLTKGRDERVLKASVGDMRALIAKEKGDSDIWDLKLVSGGLLDIEFLAQYLSLRHAAEHPAVLNVNTERVLGNARSLGLLSDTHAAILIEAHRLYSSIQQALRLAMDGGFEPSRAASGVLRRFAAAVHLPDFRTVERDFSEKRKQVRDIFEAVLS